METILIFATILSPIVIALTQAIKKTVKLKKNYIPAIALVVGLLIGLTDTPFTDLEIIERL